MRHLSRSRRPQFTVPTSIEVFEPRTLLTSTMGMEIAAIDGTGNNIDNPDWGTTHEELIRLTWANYFDGLSEPAGSDRRSARNISNIIAAVEEDRPNDRQMTDILWLWGQFIDHDLDLTEGATPAEPFNIPVPNGDIFFDPFGTGEEEIPLNRSIFEVDGDGIRQQINEISAFLDGSVVYGSDAARAAALRTFQGGLLKTSEGDLLPFNEAGLPNAGGTASTLFLAGDVRANENVALSAMHTLWVREHNRLAQEISESHPDLTDEEIYQKARAIVRAELQVITYNEFLPALLGPNALSSYSGYDPNVNPGISNEFSTAAYRFGHSLLSPTLTRLDANGNVIPEGNLPLQQAFFRPSELQQTGVDPLLRGLSSSLAQELDNQIVDDVRNFLFGPPGSGGFDLASLNIQRGRDHGIPGYNDVRDALGLGRLENFEEMSSDPDVVSKLRTISSDIDNLDLWVAGLAEDHLPGSSMGETFTAILVDQFERLRDGDRFWYQNLYDGYELAELEATTLTDIIQRNTGIRGLQANAFFAPEEPPSNNPNFDLMVIATGPGVEGQVHVSQSTTGQQQFPPAVPFPGFFGGIRVATGDVNNDGVPDVITAPGPGGGPHIRILNGLDGSIIGEFLAFDANFTGGVYVAAADISGPNGHPDGFDDLVLSADAGGGPHVKVVSGHSINGSAQPSELMNLFAYDSAFTGGVRVAAGDISGDGTPDIIMSPGPGGGPHVRVFDGTKLNNPEAIAGGLGNFHAYNPAFLGGVFVSAGDVDGDGQIDIITSPDLGGGPHVRVFGGSQQEIIGEFFAYGQAFLGGVRIASTDINNDGKSEIITAPGTGGGPHIRVLSLDHSTSDPVFVEQQSFLAINSAFLGGLYVAGGTRLESVLAQPLTLATDGTANQASSPLTAEELEPLVSVAIERLEDLGLSEALSDQLLSTTVEIADLSGDRLGESLPGRVRIDVNAAGAGWFVDETPFDDSEFSESTTDPGTLGRVDLLTVLWHEFLHELGLDHDDSQDGLMAETLSTGQRRLPVKDDLDHLFADGDLLDSVLDESELT